MYCLHGRSQGSLGLRPISSAIAELFVVFAAYVCNNKQTDKMNLNL